MMSDGTQPSVALGDRPSAQRFRPLPSCGVAAPAFSEGSWVSPVPDRKSALPCLRIDGTESRASIFLPRDAAPLLHLRRPLWAGSASACIFLLTHFFVRTSYFASMLRNFSLCNCMGRDSVDLVE